MGRYCSGIRSCRFSVFFFLLRDAKKAKGFVELKITDTEPGFKGDTATGATKPAVVETGATVYVPLFVEQDDVIKIDTRTGEYLSRV